MSSVGFYMPAKTYDLSTPQMFIKLRFFNNGMIQNNITIFRKSSSG